MCVCVCVCIERVCVRLESVSTWMGGRGLRVRLEGGWWRNEGGLLGEVRVRTMVEGEGEDGG